MSFPPLRPIQRLLQHTVIPFLKTYNICKNRRLVCPAELSFGKIKLYTLFQLWGVFGLSLNFFVPNLNRQLVSTAEGLNRDLLSYSFSGVRSSGIRIQQKIPSRVRRNTRNTTCAFRNFTIWYDGGEVLRKFCEGKYFKGLLVFNSASLLLHFFR